MKKIAIFGGTFDPVHKEHFEIAINAIKELNLDKLIVMPTFLSPHKTIVSAPANDRLEMLKIVFGGNPKIEVSDYEIKNEGKSYSYITAEHIKKENPNSEIFWIMGADMLVDFKTWKNPERILAYAKIAVFDRENTPCDFEKEIGYIENNLHGEVIKLNYIGKDFSSTRIRTYLALDLDYSKYIDEKVTNYIKEHNLYIDDKYVPFLKAHLKPTRIVHTAGVVISAMSKAKENNLDGNKVYLSALLHDCAKYLDPKDYPDCKIDEDVPKPVIHSFLGAYVAENVLGVKDQEVLEAIRYHTSGKANMTTLGKLIFVADMVEENRTYAGVEKLRELFNKNLEVCFIGCLAEEMVHLKMKNEPIFIETINAYEYYIGK